MSDCDAMHGTKSAKETSKLPRRDKFSMTQKTIKPTCYPHMPIGKVWIYSLLFVCL